jgi:hypothetical protein
VIVIGPRDDAVLKNATRALLTAAGIEVLWRGVPWGEPERIEGDAWTLEDMSHGPHLYSLVELPPGQRVNCSIWAFLYEGTLNDPPEDDWLYLDMPVEALARLDARIGAYPSGDGSQKEEWPYGLGRGNEPSSLVWRRPIDDWLSQVAIEVGGAVSFQRAIIGCDVRGDDGVSPKPERDRPLGLVLSDGTYLPATY